MHSVRGDPLPLWHGCADNRFKPMFGLRFIVCFAFALGVGHMATPKRGKGYKDEDVHPSKRFRNNVADLFWEGHWPQAHRILCMWMPRQLERNMWATWPKPATPTTEQGTCCDAC